MAIAVFECCFLSWSLFRCSNDALAERLWDKATAYVASKGWPPYLQRKQPSEHGPSFDYRSIMILGSMEGSADPNNKDIAKSAILVDTREEAKAWHGMIYMGGNSDPRKVSIFDSDIERVKQLYPRQGGPSKQQRDTCGGWPPMKVVR